MSDLPVIECIRGDTSDIIELAIQTNPINTGQRILTDLDPNYTCKIQVGGASIDKAVVAKTADNKYFRGWLTPAETAALVPGDYPLAMQISNATLTPALVKEKQFTLRILAQIAT
jgi:hypothetical protein